MRTRTRAFAKLSGLIGAAACVAGAQSGHFYADILPDTLQPGETYVFGTPPPIPAKISANVPNRWPDTLDLKRGATTMRVIGDYGVGGFGQGYRLAVPDNAGPGAYDAYAPSGALLESNVAFVPDVQNLVPRLIVKRMRGLRGGAYSLAVGAMGLAFGPLIHGTPFASTIRYAALELGKDTLRLQDIHALSPYSLQASITVPAGSQAGPYRLVVERDPGVRSAADSAFEVWVPEAPVVQSIVPDSLVAGDSGTLGITGLNLDYAVERGSDVYLDPTLVKEVHIRKGAWVLPANRFPQLGDYRQPPQVNVLARFDVPLRTDPGAYDLGIVIAGRPDTSYFPGRVRVVRRPPEMISFAPSTAAREPFLAGIVFRYLLEDYSKAAYALRRGKATLAGTFSDTLMGMAEVRFSPDTATDTGWYDFEADFPGLPTLARPHAVYIAGPVLDPVVPSGWVQGRSDTLAIRVSGASFPPASGADPGQSDTANLQGVWLCRDSRCLQGSDAAPRFRGWNVRISVPPDWPPGAYDAVVRTLHPQLTLTRPGAVVIAPAGYRPLLPSPAPYWDLKADSLGLLGIGPAQGCRTGDYAREDGPSGPVLSDGLLQWTPSPADTGWHAFRISGTGSCRDKLFLMAYVAPHEASGIRAARPGGGTGGAYRARLLGNGLELEMPEAAEAEIRSLSGRLLARLGRLEPGRHGIALPLSAHGEALLLCRLRSASGDEWLKIPRMP